MAAEHQGYEIDPKDWPGLLTDNLRDHFDRMGEEIVRHDVTNHNYGEKEKHFAALHWLDVKRRKKDKQNFTLRIVAWLTLIAAIIAIVVSID